MTTAVTYRYSAVPFTAVTVTDDFWSPRLETNRRVTIPYDFAKCEETGRIANFDKAAGNLEGDHEGLFFNDSDVYKIIEGAAYSLSLHPDPALDAYLDNLIARIAAAQEPDGYLYTARTIAERTGRLDRLRAEREGLTRWSNLRVSHELYNVGHLYEAAVAHYRATSKRTLLDIALRSANLLDQVFGPGKRHDVPGHQEVEIGLVKLYGVTGDRRYLDLAKFFLDERGHAHGRMLYANYDNPGYMQDHLPVVEQREAVGHAVRAVYMYAGMADVATLTGAADYITALDALWGNVVGRKLYLTGAIGARHRGEAFGDDYELPCATAYAETCAAIGNALWNQRMFQLHGDAAYLDTLERTIYNGLLSGISLSGDLFFYVNPLEFDGVTPFYREYRDTIGRQPWFDCSCCPSNLVRFLPSLPGYIYAHQGDDLYVNLFISSQAVVPLTSGAITVRQHSAYPWDGNIRVDLDISAPRRFTVRLRIPGWARNEPVPSDLYHYCDKPAPDPTLAINGIQTPYTLERGFAVITRTWQPGDRITLHLPMPVRRVVAHHAVTDTRGRVAVERGPLVYCAEGIDNTVLIANIVLLDDTELRPFHQPAALGGMTVLRGEQGDTTLTLIPYCLWAHRGTHPMTVWLKHPTAD